MQKITLEGDNSGDLDLTQAEIVNALAKEGHVVLHNTSRGHSQLSYRLDRTLHRRPVAGPASEELARALIEERRMPEPTILLVTVLRS